MSEKASIKHTLTEWALALLFVIRRLIGPPGLCKYTVTCTAFAAWQFRNQPFHIACIQTLKRLRSCSFGW